MDKKYVRICIVFYLCLIDMKPRRQRKTGTNRGERESRHHRGLPFHISVEMKQRCKSRQLKQLERRV